MGKENIIKGEEKGFEPMTTDDERKQQRKRKWELIAGAIGEGASAISNLIFATQGAPYTGIKTGVKGKTRSKSLIEAIKGKHTGEDAEYGKKLSAWEKEQEKKRKEAERLTKENDVIEDIHENYRPKTLNWDNEAYIDFVFDKLKKDIEHKTSKYNDTGEYIYYQDGPTVESSTFSGTIRPGEAYPNESEVMKYINRFDLKGKAKKYFKQMIISNILGGENKYKEIDDEFLDKLRDEMMDMDLNFVK